MRAIAIAGALAAIAVLVGGTTPENATPSLDARTWQTAPTQVRRCPEARAGLRWYRSKIALHVSARGLPQPIFREHPRKCERVLELAAQVRAKAALERERYEAWRSYHYDWPSWLPAGWQRIGACETGYGRIPGNWQHNSGAYQGTFGFAVRSWDDFVPRADPKAGPYPSEAYLATPRQQYEVALAIYRMYGLSGWGCRGAYYGS